MHARPADRDTACRGRIENPIVVERERLVEERVGT